MAKEYKPGQFVSIGGKLCRVKPYRGVLVACHRCRMLEDCIMKKSLSECICKLGMHNYPEPIKSE